MMPIYLDFNSTAPLRAEARETWLETATQLAGNPSSLHAGGRRARHVIDVARERVAAALRVHEDEILFTSGGTESNNLALFGTLTTADPTVGLVTTAIEHSSVLEAARELERRGHRLQLIAVQASGAVDPEAVVAAARQNDVALISVQAANSEVGTLAPLRAIADGLANLDRPPPVLHTDAVQALGRIPTELDRWGASLASFSAHKVGGPVGVGVLVRRSRAPRANLHPLQFGGGQEYGLRPGTEDVAGVAAAAVAVELAVAEQSAYYERTRTLTQHLWRELEHRLPAARLLGEPLDSDRRLPNTLNISLPGSDGKVLVTRLDLEGLQVSAGSACASGSLEPSHVLLAMGCSTEEARAGLRLSVGSGTTKEECTRAVDILEKVVSSSRAS